MDSALSADKIALEMMETIRTGKVGQGERLPSIRALAGELGVNRNRVGHAYKELAEKGYLRTCHGGGSYASWPDKKPNAAPGLGNFTAGIFASPPKRMAEETTQGPLSEEEWALRFARPLNASFRPSGKTADAPDPGREPINLYQLHPNTELFPLERFRKCMNTVLRRSGRHLLSYGSPAGYLPLQEQIALRLRARHIQVQAEQILITSGSQQGIDLLTRAFLEPGDQVVVEAPTYTIAIRMFMAAGAHLIPYPVKAEGISFQALDNYHFQPAPKLFYAMPHFQNPTTHSYSLEEKQALLAHVHRNGSLLVEDAYDGELHAQSHPALAALDNAQRVVYLNTFSKTMAPALRVGYLMGPPVVVRRLTELKEMSDLSHSLILQAAIAEFLERGYFEAHQERMCAFYRERMALVGELLHTLFPPEIRVALPEGGLFIWVDLPPQLDAELICQKVLSQGVRISPGALFMPFPGGRNGLRICIAWESKARLEKGLTLLARELKRALRHPPPLQRGYQATH